MTRYLKYFLPILPFSVCGGVGWLCHVNGAREPAALVAVMLSLGSVAWFGWIIYELSD